MNRACARGTDTMALPAESDAADRVAPTTPKTTLALLADLRDQHVSAVAANLDEVRRAQQGGDQGAIAHALLGQAALLEALGVRLLTIAGTDTSKHQRFQLFSNLGLRALDQARKALSTLAGLGGPPTNHTNVQVNIAKRSNELLGADRDLVG